MVHTFGPDRETLAPAQRASAQQFRKAVGSLADGGVVFPAPFDLGTAAGLADNDADDTDAVDICTAVAAETAIRYHVQITQVVDDRPDLRRQIIDTVTDPQYLRPLLADAIRTITTPTEGRP